ncbi:hypothetical protein [Clostridium sulfidigenes]|uniref:hypothetical protein n=1 Tax=Clostridium sulfidigenes TaxID=318464 RepID=UPI003F8C27AD
MKKLMNKINSTKETVRERITRKSKGAVNFLEISVIVVILLVVLYPLYKDMLSASFTTIKAWFAGFLPSIFS